MGFRLANVAGRAALVDGDHYFDLAELSDDPSSADPMVAITMPQRLGELSATLSGLESRTFLVYHPAWGYFADAYGLTQIPIEREGKAPGARRLTALIEQARATGTRVIFVQPQFDRRAAERVAQAINGRVEAVDPLAPDYADNLRRVAGLIAAANGGAAEVDGAADGSNGIQAHEHN